MVYQTNADYIATEEALANNKLVIVIQTKKGLLWFRFVESHTIFLLSPLGNLQVHWSDINEKKTLYKLVKNLLIANPNEKLVIKPLKQQLWIEYPVPDPFKVYWCNEATEYILKKPSLELTKKRSEIETEKRIQESRAEQAKVKKALDELRHEFRFFREPTLNEVALKTGIMNTQQLGIDLLLGGWKNEAQENVKKNAEAALNLAAWLSYKEKVNQNLSLITRCKKAIDSAYMESLKHAQIILQHYPDIVPRVEENQLKWPDETKVKWIEVFAAEPPLPQTWK